MSRYLVIDSETTGLDPESNGLITFSAVVYENQNKIAQWHGANKQWDKFVIDTSALRVNNISFYSSDFFSVSSSNIVSGNAEAGYYLLETYETFVKFLTAFLIENAPACDFLMGMNVQFDLAFLKKACRSFNINIEGLLPRKQIDPLIIASSMSDTGLYYKNMKYINSKNLYEYHGISHEGIHRSDVDVRLTFELWQKMKKDFLS